MVNQKNGIFSKLTGMTFTLFKLKLENINQEIDENASSLEKAILYGNSNLKCRKIIFVKDLMKFLMDINYDNFKRYIYPLILKLSNDNLEIKNEICNKIGDLCAYLLQNNNDNDGCTDIIKLLFPIMEKFIKNNENKNILGNVMKSLLILSTHINSKSRKKVIFPFILSLISNDKYKHIGFILLVKICYIFDKDIIFSFLIPYMESFLRNKDLSSKIYISSHLFNICKMLNEEDLSGIFIIFKKLCSDENDIIKIINIYNCAHISSLYSKTVFFYFFVPIYNNFLKNCNLYIFYYSLINLFSFICNFEDIDLIHPFYIRKLIFFFNSVFSSHLFTLNYLSETAKKQSNYFFLNSSESQINHLEFKINENQENKIESINNFDEIEVSNCEFNHLDSNEKREINSLYYFINYDISQKSDDTSLKLDKIKELNNNYIKEELSSNLKNMNDNEDNNSLIPDKMKVEDISVKNKTEEKIIDANFSDEENVKANISINKKISVESYILDYGKKNNETNFDENTNNKNKMKSQENNKKSSKEYKKKNEIKNIKEDEKMKNSDEYSTNILSNNSEFKLKEYNKTYEIKSDADIRESNDEKKNDEYLEDDVENFFLCNLIKGKSDIYKNRDTKTSIYYEKFYSNSHDNFSINEKNSDEVSSSSFFFNNSLINDLIINNNHFCLSIKNFFEIYDNNNYTFKKIDEQVDNIEEGNSKLYFSFLNEKELKIIDNAFNHNIDTDINLIKGCFYNELELIKKNTVYTKMLLKKENKNKSKNSDNIDNDDNDIYNIGDIDIDLLKKKYIFDSSSNIIESHNINSVYITTLYIPILILVFKKYFFRFFSHVFFFICTYPYYFIRKTIASLFFDILQNFLNSDFLIISDEQLNYEHENIDKFLKKRKIPNRKKFLSTLTNSLKVENKSYRKMNNKGSIQKETTGKILRFNNNCAKYDNVDNIKNTKSINKNANPLNIDKTDMYDIKEYNETENNKKQIKKDKYENIEYIEGKNIKEEKKNDSDNNYKEEKEDEKKHEEKKQIKKKNVNETKEENEEKEEKEEMKEKEEKEEMKEKEEKEENKEKEEMKEKEEKEENKEKEEMKEKKGKGKKEEKEEMKEKEENKEKEEIKEKEGNGKKEEKEENNEKEEMKEKEGNGKKDNEKYDVEKEKSKEKMGKIQQKNDEKNEDKEEKNNEEGKKGKIESIEEKNIEKEKKNENKDEDEEKEDNKDNGDNENIDRKIKIKDKIKDNKYTKLNNYKNKIKKIQNQINTNLYESDFFINEENENFFFYKKFLNIYENIYIKFIDKFRRYYNEDSQLFFFHFFIYYFLKDNNVLVKKAILKNYDKILLFFPNKIQKILISYLFNVLEFKTVNYSLRKKISKIIFKIVLKTDDTTIIRKYLFPIFVKLCKDDVALIRTYTSNYFYLFLKKGCPNIYNFFKGNGKILPLEEYQSDVIISNEDNFKLKSNYFIDGDEISLIKKIIITFAKSKHFYDRQIFIKMCEGIINECPINLFLLYFLNPFLNLSEDKIQVVRITWEKCVSSQIKKKGVFSKVTNVLEKLYKLYEKYEKMEKSKIDDLVDFNDSHNFSVRVFDIHHLDS
ncbi:conserved Plasmodium protein, unknown function [Plasmodium gallinaceum]|uniref:Uncharacterized protein n=1 Tax=Plasmodium gallinaceum TaxID=5849 RepID=A0A1J1GYP7_PLAGA|nr:conserved Plasmodium protein, unknown function [Plasmodium gallinaceum]CRG97361.1 conserved Plasmodium protein, unknown function [Plasmodium gallinaceum]